MIGVTNFQTTGAIGVIGCIARPLPTLWSFPDYVGVDEILPFRGGAHASPRYRSRGQSTHSRHSYKAEITVAGTPERTTGMIMDIGALDLLLSKVRFQLDHQFLDDIADMGPATMENIARWIWDRLANTVPGLARVSVLRESCGERCAYEGRAGGA